MTNQLKFNCLINRLFVFTVFGLALLGLNQNANANQILYLEGDIELKRQGSTEFEPADYLDYLNDEDTIKIGANSTVEIRCSYSDSVAIKELGRHRVSDYCVPGEEFLGEPALMPGRQN